MDAETALADPEIAAIVIASSTPTHSDYIEAGAAAGKHFFLERYSTAYRAEWDHFVDVLDGTAEATPTGADGALALAMADAAYESLETGRRVTLNFD